MENESAKIAAVPDVEDLPDDIQNLLSELIEDEAYDISGSLIRPGVQFDAIHGIVKIGQTANGIGYSRVIIRLVANAKSVYWFDIADDNLIFSFVIT